MPVSASPVDWELGKALFVQGWKAHAIAEKLTCPEDTVRKRISRGNWTALRDCSKAMLVQSEKSVQTGDAPAGSESARQSQASARAREALSNELSRAVDTLTATAQSKRLEAQAKRANVLQTLAGAGKVIHGWSDGQTAPAIRIGVLAQVTIQPASAPEPSQSQPVIEVESTPVSVTEVGPIHDKS